MKDGVVADGAAALAGTASQAHLGALNGDVGRRVSAALEAVVVLGEELTVRGRLQRTAELGPSFVDGRWGAVAVLAADHAVQEWLFNVPDLLDMAWLVPALTSASSLRRGGARSGLGTVAAPGSTEELTVLSVPLETAAGVAGELFVARPRSEGTFGSADQQVLRGFARVAALGLDNAAQYEQSRQRAGWLRASAQISRELLTSDQDEMGVWQEVVDTVRRLAHARTVTLVMPGEESDDDLDIRVAAGLGAEQLRDRSYPRSGSLTGQVMATGSMQITHASRYPISHAEVAPEVPVGPVLALPLQGQNQQPRAAILVSRSTKQPPFSVTDVQLAEDFANQAAIALELAETRAAQQRLEHRELLDRIADSYQDRIIQRLYAISLRLETVTHQNHEAPPSWLTGVIDDIDTTITEARTSLTNGLNKPPHPA